MSLPMADQTGFLGERLTANIANVRSFSGVNQHVLFLSSLSSKSFSADRAGKRFHSGMYSHVRVQIASPESLAASRTEYLLPSLVPHEMLL